MISINYLIIIYLLTVSSNDKRIWVRDNSCVKKTEHLNSPEPL